MTAGADLTALNTLQLHATAQRLVTVASSDQLQAEIAALDEGVVPYVLGGGSNVILCDHLPGTTLLMAIKGREVLSDAGAKVVTRVGAGESWHDFVVWCHHQGFHGLANLALIPGSVGGAPIQNIGAYGVELSDVLSSVEVFDLKTNQLIRLSAESCGLSYRDSIFKNKRQDQYVITSITLKLYKSQQLNLSYPDLANYFHGKENPTPSEVSNAVITIRRNKLPDPQFEPNVGSFFKNPIISRGRLNSILSKNKDEKDLPHTHIGNDRVKISAAWLIDKCGLKGLKIGGVEVHKKQPLVLINRSRINDQDVFSNLTRAVMEIKQKVQTKYGISLEIEPRIYGDFKID